MKEYLEVIEHVPLFRGVNQEELLELLYCLTATSRSFSKGEAIFRAGDTAIHVGIVLSGMVQVVKEDFLGNRTILTKLDVGGLFGESFACAKIDKLPVSVFAVAASKILFVDYRRIITTCSASCVFHHRLVENMLGILAGKNVMLNQKIEVLSKRATRDKLIAYLSAQAQAAGSRSFIIPFDRQELADYLCVDRSAMSAELCRLRDEGLLSFHRSRFEILDEME